VNRQPGSSTRFLVGLMLQEENIPTSSVSGFEDSEFTHMAIAAHIASGMADVGIGVQTAAHRFGLDFIPLVRERYFFALNRNSLQQINVEKFIHFMRSQDYLQFLGQLVGYDATEAGKIQTLDEAFND
jgi:molybdate-binding protein